MFTPPNTKAPIYSRTRSLLRSHNAPDLLVSPDRPLPIGTPIEAQARVDDANNLLLDTDDQVQTMLQDQVVTFLNADQTHQANHIRNMVMGTDRKNRPDVTGFQRATIYNSNVDCNILAESHQVSLSTVYRIKNDPLASIGLTWKQLEVTLGDFHGANVMNWYSNVSGEQNLVIPPLPNAPRPGRSTELNVLHRSFLRQLLTSDPDLYLDEILSSLLIFDPDVTISISTLSKTLLAMGFTRSRPTKAISTSNPMERNVFALAIEEIVTNVDQLVFLDEAANGRDAGNRPMSRSPAKLQSLGVTRAVGRRHTL